MFRFRLPLMWSRLRFLHGSVRFNAQIQAKLDHFHESAKWYLV